MCGFPLLHLDKHLKTLVQQEKRFVAMCEEFPRNITTNTKEFDRRISRIITPGTLIDESFLNPFENNYVLAINPTDISDSLYPVGLAWTDISTGQFFSKQCAVENLQDELARVGPREVILHSSLRTVADHPVVSALNENGCTVSYFTPDPSDSSPVVDSAVLTRTSNILTPSRLPIDTETFHTTKNLTTTASDFKSISCVEVPHSALSLPLQEELAIQLLTNFLRQNLLEHMPVLDSPIHESSQQLMQIDAHTIHALEIRENDYETGVKGSLLSIVKRTVTTGGTRLLARWVCEDTKFVNAGRY